MYTYVYVCIYIFMYIYIWAWTVQERAVALSHFHTLTHKNTHTYIYMYICYKVSIPRQQTISHTSLTHTHVHLHVNTHKDIYIDTYTCKFTVATTNFYAHIFLTHTHKHLHKPGGGLACAARLQRPATHSRHSTQPFRQKYPNNLYVCESKHVSVCMHACIPVRMYVHKNIGNRWKCVEKSSKDAHTRTCTNTYMKDVRSRSRCCALARSLDQSRERVFSAATVSLSISRTHSPSFTHMYNYTRMGAAWR